MSRRIPTLAIKSLIVIAACVFAAGCGGIVQVAYNNGDFALRMVADDYFDLQKEQARYLQKQLAHFHHWHRREELPIYARTFAGAAERVKRGVAREDAIWAMAEVRERYRALIVQAIEDGTPVLATLKEENFKALEKKLAENNAKFAKEYPLDNPETQDRARAKRLEERLESFLGELTDEQHALVMGFAQSQPRVSQARIDYHKRRQREFVDLLRRYGSSPDLAPRLRDYFLTWKEDAEMGRKKETRDWEDRIIAFILDVDRTMTAQQRAHAVQKFGSYADDCLVLAR